MTEPRPGTLEVPGASLCYDVRSAHGGTAARRHGGTAARRHGGTAARDQTGQLSRSAGRGAAISTVSTDSNSQRRTLLPGAQFLPEELELLVVNRVAVLGAGELAVPDLVGVLRDAGDHLRLDVREALDEPGGMAVVDPEQVVEHQNLPVGVL